MDISTIILVGGRGTRIAHLRADTPKPLVMVHGRPFLDWLIFYLARAGLRRFVLSSGYKAEQIDDWAAQFPAQQAMALDFRVVREAQPLGTGGAILSCLSLSQDWFLALNGDSLALLDLGRILSLAGRADLDGALVGLAVSDTSRYGSLDVDPSGHLRGFHEKRPGSGLINAGIYLFRKASIEAFQRPGQVSIETDILPAMIGAGAKIMVVDAGIAPFIDIGTPETLAAADQFVAQHQAMFAV